MTDFWEMIIDLFECQAYFVSIQILFKKQLLGKIQYLIANGKFLGMKRNMGF